MQTHIVKTFEEHLSTIRDDLFLVSSITILPFGINGQLIENSIEYLYGDSWGITDEFLDRAAHECIKWALPKTKAIFHAPHGYRFQKPSGQPENVFVRAGNMLLYQDLLTVFCHLILRKMPENATIIFIDSFTIYSFALGLQSLLGYFSRQSGNSNTVIPLVENFHSYDIEPNFRLPNTKDYFVIISASTADELREKLIKDHNAEESRIIHLLGIGPSGSSLQDSSIYFEERNTETKYLRESKVIGINTEEFMVSHGNVIPVRITKKHVLKEQTDVLQDTFYQESLHLRMAGTSSGYGPPSLFSINNSSGIPWPNAFLNWLKQQLVHEIPASVRTIVHMNDPESEKMGETIQRQFRSVYGLNQISLVSNDDFGEQKISTIPNNSTVLIIANEDPNLGQLGAINIRLRSNPEIFRHYVLGYAFPDSNRQLQRRVNELRLASGSRPKFGWSNFRVIPVGPIQLHEAILTNYGIDWTESQELSNAVEKDIFETHRRQASGCDTQQSLEIFFPSLCGRKLALRHGSIFFSVEEEHSKDVQPHVSQEVVYLVVSSALQQARECGNKSEPELGFDENPFIKSVIDPMMFMRFNDGIIQAALLRALSKSELDFSSCDEMSLRFRQIVTHVMTNSNNTAGEAVLEFLAAVVRKKVALIESDFDDICNAAMENQNLKPYLEFFLRKSPI